MSTGRHTFRLNDTARLIRATEAAGKKVKSVSLEGKRVTVLVDEAADLTPSQTRWTVF